MELYFLDANYKLISMPIEDFASLTWTESWTEPGKFTLYVDFKYFPTISQARYIYNTDAQKAASIETISYKQADGERVILTGRTLEALMERRVAQKAYSIYSSTAKVEESVYKIFNQYASGTRDLNGMTAGATVIGYTDTGELSIKRGDNLGEWMYSALETYGMSPEVVVDMDTETANLTVKKLADRTIDNTEGNSPVILSQSFENTKNDAYAWDETELINHAYVVMEDDPCYGTVTIEVDRQQSEEPRVETYVKSSASSEPDSTGAATVELAECYAIMRQEGNEALEGHELQESITCTVEQNSIYEYRKDFFVGDKISCTSSIVGVDMDAQITSVTETYEAGGKKVDIQIGRDFTAVNYLRKLVKKAKGGKV